MPGADAAEEEVARYLTHVGECPFHAALEQREIARVRHVVAPSSPDFDGHDSELRYHGNRRGAGHDRRGDIRRKTSIDTLSIRVNGSERARIHLSAARQVALEVEPAALIAVWQPRHTDGDEDVYLTSYVLAAEGNQVSERVLDGGQRISFKTEANTDSGMQITVTYAPSNWWHRLRMFVLQRAHTSVERAGSLRWSPARLAVTLCALLVAVLLVFVFWLRTEVPVPVANQDQPRQTGAQHAPPLEQTAPPYTASEENRNLSSAPFPTPASRVMPDGRTGGRRGSTQAASNTGPPSREQLTVANVRRIYVSPGDNAYDRQLSAALIDQLRAGATFTIVEREQQADAVLKREQSRGTDVSTQLLSRTGKSLWFTIQPADSEDAGDVNKVAASIVTALTAAANKRPTPVKTSHP